MFVFGARLTLKIVSTLAFVIWQVHDIFTSMPLLDSYATIGIKKTCFTSRVRERQADKNINWMTVVSRNEKISHALRWTRTSCSDSIKERKSFLLQNLFFCSYPRARQPIASYLSKNIPVEIFKSYSWTYDKMLIDWVKSYIIPIYTYEVAAFFD